jgi:ribosomal-protein-alanine N-acetyltransferase
MTTDPTIRIREMIEDDLDDVRAIEEAAYGTDAWTRRALKDELINGFSSYIVAQRADGRVAGFAGVWFMRDQLHLVTIAVDPAQQRRGIASRLLLNCLEQARAAEMPSVVLEVRESNTSAQALYERFGFRTLGRLRKYYKDDGEDALVMETPSLEDEDQRRRIAELAERYA